MIVKLMIVSVLVVINVRALVEVTAVALTVALKVWGCTESH